MRSVPIFLFCALVSVCTAAEKVTVRDALTEPAENLCIPQIAAGGGWKTTLTFMNMLPGESKFGLLFLDQHAFDTLALLSQQIVPGARDAKVPEILDRLLSVESLETQKRFTSVIGAFERESREAQGKPWKALSAEQANALLTKISGLPEESPTRKAFDDLKAAVAETYYSTEVGMKEMGWQGTVAFTPPRAC